MNDLFIASGLITFWISVGAGWAAMQPDSEAFEYAQHHQILGYVLVVIIGPMLLIIEFVHKMTDPR